MAPEKLAYDNVEAIVDDDGIALCTFNRPHVHNALSFGMVEDIRRVLGDLASRGVRVLIFTGAGGKAFVSGADIAELRDRRQADAFRFINNGLMADIEGFEAPTIAAVRGFALGGGCEMAMACDIRIAGKGARFGQPEVGLGIVPGAGAVYRLPRIVGQGMARELLYTGRIIDAQEALRIGLVNRVVPDAGVINVARQIAAEIARQSALAVRYAKQAVNALTLGPVRPGMMIEASAQAVLFEEDDKLARMTAFLERKSRKKEKKTKKKKKKRKS
jgi:enoyl-CoA hydratase